MCMRHVLAVAVLLASFSEDFPVLYTRFLTFFFENSKKRDFLRFFALLHTFSRTMQYGAVLYGYTLHLYASVSACELAPASVADALLDGARTRSSTVGSRQDHATSSTSSAEATARTARSPRLPVVSQDAVHRCTVQSRQTWTQCHARWEVAARGPAAWAMAHEAPTRGSEMLANGKINR